MACKHDNNTHHLSNSSQLEGAIAAGAAMGGGAGGGAAAAAAAAGGEGGREGEARNGQLHEGEEKGDTGDAEVGVGAGGRTGGVTRARWVRRSRKGEAVEAHAVGLCSLSVFDGDPPSCRMCLKHNNGIVPGGAACCWAENLASCPRIWA